MPIEFEHARDILGSCIEALSADPTPDGLGRVFIANPDAAEAALAYFTGRYRDGHVVALAWERSPVARQIIGLILSFSSVAVRRGFITLALSVLCDAELGHVLRDVSQPDELAAAVIDALDEPEPRPRHASELAYHTFAAGGPGMEPSAALAALMNEKLRLYERTPR